MVSCWRSYFPTEHPPITTRHYKLATFSRRQKPMCLLGDIVQYRLLGDKSCNFIMNLSSGDPQPIISNVALGPSALGQHWKLLASAHHLIKAHSLIPLQQFPHFSACPDLAKFSKFHKIIQFLKAFVTQGF